MDLTQGFQEFWQRYPRKVGKLAAEKAFRKALRLATVDDILAGVDRYNMHLPREMQYVPHPATFLNQGRWLDEYDEPAPAVAVYWWDECLELHGGTCTKRWDHEMKRRAG